MINCKPYTDEAYSFYQSVCTKKQNTALDPNYRTRLELFNNNIRILYDDYDNLFDANNLEAIVAHGYVDPEKADLLKLYNYNSAALQKLKNIVTTTEHGRKVKCQNCTINDVNTFDHLVPKDDFAEFAVNPKNLIPCCSQCNSLKSNNWRNDGIRSSLNLYLDELPRVQYLFVNVEVGNRSIETNFYIDNRNNMDNRLFQLISSHYQQLRLFERFSEAADDVITALKNIIEPSRNILNLKDVQSLVGCIIEKDQIAFGYNYWQSILKLKLMGNNDFMIDYI